MTRAEFAKRAAALESLQQSVLKALQTVPAADHGTIFQLGLSWANLRLSINNRFPAGPGPDPVIVADVQSELQRLGLSDMASRLAELVASWQ